VQRMRAQIAFALRRGGDAPRSCCGQHSGYRAWTPSWPADLSRALVAAIYAGRLAADGRKAGRARREIRNAGAFPGRSRCHTRSCFIHGLACAWPMGTWPPPPRLKEALRRYRAQRTSWTGCPSRTTGRHDCGTTRPWFELAAGEVRWRARTALSAGFRSRWTISPRSSSRAGELSKAAALLMERERVDPGAREAPCPTSHCCSPVARGRADRGELAEEWPVAPRTGAGGRGTDYTDYAQAVLYNGLGNYGPAAEAAHAASAVDEIVISPGPCMSWWKPRHEAISRTCLRGG